MPKAEIDLIRQLTLVIVRQIQSETNEDRKKELLEDLVRALEDKS